jgi:hypothetical protein
VLERQDLGEEGRSYLASYLEANGRCGKQFGPLLIERYDIENGDLWAYVPSPVPIGRRAPLTDFESGGLYPRKDPEWPQRFGEWLRSLGRASASHFAIEGAYERPSNPFLQTYDEPAFFCGESVVFYSTLSDSTPTPKLHPGGATWKPDISLVTRTPTTFPADRETVAPEALAQLVNGALTVVVGAWDHEGIIFWEPAGAAS